MNGPTLKRAADIIRLHGAGRCIGEAIAAVFILTILPTSLLFIGIAFGA